MTRLDIPDPEPFDPQRQAMYERLLEATAPAPQNPCRCTCDRCTYSRLLKPAS